ncbi:EamA family transporter [Cellulophaga sp. HaHaR_3_176]|uniref:EamA family transporter n=1 Tax=Cellulophaga sp. HaHaR_3_176 TaxID=1942464 RepID=UPI001C1FECB5|nr:EamA family transporter [Cellulophaga sp. HaHaR_3_176]QWX85277.1 EamA family transporter [Cellulophaga sp. HaHaR_3_176]
MAKSSQTLLIVFAFIAIYIIWGSTYLMNKIAVTELPAYMLASIRFVTAGLLIFGICKLMKIPIRVTKRQFRNSFIAGFLFLTFGNGVFVWGLKYVDSSFAALEVAAMPLIVLILMRVIDGKKIQAMSVVGVVLGVIGIYLLVSQKQITQQEESLLGMVIIFFCVLGWSFGSLFVSKANLPQSYLVNTAYQMVTAGITLFITSLLLGEHWSWPTDWSPRVQLSMSMLIILGSIVAFTAFNYLLKTVSPDKVATSSYVNPVIALLLGWYVLDENITKQSIVAAAILLTGVYFINTKKKLVMFSRFRGKLKGKPIE